MLAGATPSTTSLHEQSSMPVLDDTSQQRSFTLSPRPPYHPPSNYQRPMPRPHPVSYVAQAGNVPLTTDYTGLPCNLQERMTIGQTHTFSMPLSLEETLANLPYDAIQLQRALSSHSGMGHIQQLTQVGVDRYCLSCFLSFCYPVACCHCLRLV